MTLPTAAEVARVLELACTLQQIPAPTFHEEQRAAFALDHFTRLELCDVHLDPAGDVLARLPGKGAGRTLVISAHMDTVFPSEVPLTLQRADETISGPGVGDNSLGLAALLALPELLRVRDIQPEGDLILAATVCEEGLGNLRGIQEVTRAFGGLAAAYLSLEGMGLGNILHRGLGVERYRLSVQASGGHSWVDFGAPSAVHALVEIAEKIARIRPPKRPRTSFNIGVIQGGTSVNTIAASAHCDIDFRSEHPKALRDIVEKAARIVHSFRKEGVSVSFEQIGWRPAGEIAPQHPVVALLAQILRDLGEEPRLDIASTEANSPLSQGYPAATIGLTTGDKAHTTAEYIHVAPLYKGLQQVLDFVALFWKTTEP